MEKNPLDQSNFQQSILDFPRQFKEGLAVAKGIKISGDFKRLVVSGVGGSSFPVDLLRTFLEQDGNDLEIIQNRNYNLPQKAFIKALNFINSFSGNTEEALSSFEACLKNNLPMVVFANGGKLLELAKNNNVPFVAIPDCVQPRCATGYFFCAMIQVLSNSDLTKDYSSAILDIQGKLASNMASFQEKGLILAKKLVGKTPVIYASENLKPIALTSKIQLNENAKTPAFWNYFPELNHNELVGWTLSQGKFHLVIFQEKNTHPQIAKRMKITATLLKEKNIESDIINLESDSLLENIFSALLIGSWISYHLALEYGIDPTPVAMVEDFKKQL